jgi:hypothetical protein
MNSESNLKSPPNSTETAMKNTDKASKFLSSLNRFTTGTLVRDEKTGATEGETASAVATTIAPAATRTLPTPTPVESEVGMSTAADPTPQGSAWEDRQEDAPVPPRKVARVETGPKMNTGAPLMRMVDARDDDAPTESVQQETRSRSSRKKTSGNETFARTFEVAAGKGTRVLTARIPRELHARVYLVATNNRFAEADAPHTINELVQEALNEWLSKHDAA